MKFKILSLMLLSLIGATSVKNGDDAPLFNLLNQDAIFEYVKEEFSLEEKILQTVSVYKDILQS